MKKNILLTYLSIVLLLFIASCKEDVPTSPDKGNSNSLGGAKFTSYVAIGNSITAGIQDGALCFEGQTYAYPNQIIGQVKKLDPSITFEVPWVSDKGPNDPGSWIGSKMSITKLTAAGPDIAITVGTGIPANLTLARPYNNLGVSGAILWIPNAGQLPITDLFQPVSFLTSSQRGNASFALVLRSEVFGKTLFQQAKNLTPTFISAWLGNNDVLGYATSGGTSPSIPTPAAMFQNLYKMMIDSLAGTGAQLIVANIPDVTSVPFFNAISIIHPVTKVGCYAQTTTGIRQLGEGDYLTLQAKVPLAAGLGALLAAPLPSVVVLDKDEVAIAQKAVTDFNNIIATVCAAKNLSDGKPVPVVDINGLFKTIKASGIYYAGEKFTADYIKGGLFSLDGVHPSNKGQAVIANEFLKLINQRYNANIPLVDMTKIPGIRIPL